MTMRQEQESRIRPLVVPDRQADLIGLEMAEIPLGARLDLRQARPQQAFGHGAAADVGGAHEHDRAHAAAKPSAPAGCRP